MFKPGSGKDPTLNHGRWLKRFFDCYNLDVQSHDFRTSQATRYFAACNDLLLTSKFLGHSSVKTTEKYLKPNKDAMLTK